MDTIITSPSGQVIMYPSTNPRIVKCHSDHRPKNLSLLYHTCILNRMHAQRLHMLPSSFLQSFQKCVTISCPMKNEIMNGNQGGHVTYVWTWRRSKQILNFCRTFHPFIQHHDSDAVYRRTHRSPMSHFLNRRVGIGCQALNLRSPANSVFKMSRMDACLQNVQHI